MAEDSPRRGRLAPLTATRIVVAPLARVWTLCTTKPGLESWWAPDGFVLSVERIEVRVGGRVEFRYEEAAAARDPKWRAELEARGQGTSWTARGTFTVVEPGARFEFHQRLDFGHGRPPQEYRHRIEMRPQEDATLVVSRAEAPASKHWALLGKANLAGQLDRLDRAIVAASE
jgi:uncharacterized protein YndB with AHSA1/START domain